MPNLSPSLLLDCLPSNRILVAQNITSRKKLLQTVATLLATDIDDGDHSKSIYHLLWEREKLGNTGIGEGVGLPHARFDKITSPRCALVTLEESVDYDAPDGQGVCIAFGLLVPTNAEQTHLDLLRDVARIFSNDQQREDIRDSNTAEEVLAFLNNWIG